MHAKTQGRLFHASIRSLRRRGFHNLPHDLPRAHFLLCRSVNSCFLTVPFHANRNSVFFQRCPQEPSESCIVSGPHFAGSLRICRRFHPRRGLRCVFLHRQPHIHRSFFQKLFENYFRFREIR